MDPHHSAQDVLRCNLCETPGPSMSCKICGTHLCITCVGKHLLDESKEHKVLPFEKKEASTKCQKHLQKICEYHCEQCDIPICKLCVFSEKHLTHDVVDIFDSLESKKFALKTDLKELEEYIYPKYQEIKSYIPVQKDNMHKNSQNLKTAINRNEEIWRREIENIVKKLKSEIDEMDLKHLTVLNKWELEIKSTISEIIQSIADLKKLLASTDINLVSAYNSKNAEFTRLSAKLKVSLPNFTSKNIDTERLFDQFGSLSAYCITTEEPEKSGSSSLKPLRSVPQIITSINTQYKGHLKWLNSISCYSDEEILTCGDNSKIMSLYNLKGELMKTIQTKSENTPYDIMAIKNGDLVYADYKDRTVNIVRDRQVRAVIRLRGWKPLNVCCTSAGDLLVAMNSDDCRQTKVLRYNGSTMKQSIQFNDSGKPLFSTEGNTKYISENRNLDICVSDYGKCAVVVISRSGQLRFTYTGFPRKTKVQLIPCGITTDSQCRILIADLNNECVHILDQDGNFLSYIDNCNLRAPWGLCVDTKDNLFVAENRTGIVKKIRYVV